MVRVNGLRQQNRLFWWTARVLRLAGLVLLRKVTWENVTESLRSQRAELRELRERGVGLDAIERQLVANAQGVLHIGAAWGQEAPEYGSKPVIWIEANPRHFARLEANLQGYARQEAVCVLLGDMEGKSVRFFLSSNDELSSSIYPLTKGHRTMAGLKMVDELSLPMRRLDKVFEGRDMAGFTHWIVDVQGAELDVLRGAGDLLRFAHTLKIEVSTRAVYDGGVQLPELAAFLAEAGLYPMWSIPDDFHGDCVFVRYPSSGKR